MEQAIRNPNDPGHFMRIKPVSATVIVRRGDHILAETNQAKLVLEVGRDLYDPVYYIPEADVMVSLIKNTRSTHCPLKGKAAYFDLPQGQSEMGAEDLAWSYPEPLEISQALKGYFGFYSNQVTQEIRGNLI